MKHEMDIAKQDTNRVKIGIDLCSNYWGINSDSSFKYGQQALTLSKKIKYYDGESRSLHVLGTYYRNLGDYAKALALTFEGLQIAENNHLIEATINCYNGIANVYRELKDKTKAIRYFKRGLKLSVAMKDHPWTTNLEMNIGRAYLELNQLDSASYYINKAYLKANLPRNTIILRSIYTNLGELQFQQGNYQQAFVNVHKNILINQKKDDHRYLSIAYNTLSDFFKKLNLPDSSIFYAKKGLIEAQGINFKSGILKASRLLAELYEPKDFKIAFYYYKIANSTNDELYGPTKTLELQKTLAEEQERQRQKEAQRIEYENQLKQYAYLAGFAILLLIAFLLYRNNRQKHKANIDLQEQKDKVDKTLSQLKSTQAQLIQSEKLASLGELTAGIAHEIQNPLNFVNNFSEVSAELVQEIKEERQKPRENQDETLVDEIFNDISQNLEKITLHGKRASSIVKGMLEHSRQSSGERELIDINILTDEYLRLSSHGIRAKDNSFNSDYQTDFDENLPKIEVITQDMGRVLLNLINNAFWAVNERCKKGEAGYEPKVIISTQLKANSQLLIAIKDNGLGMTEEVKAKIFQPFFTTKPTGQGTGLGLSLAYDIVTKGHGGTIEVESVENEGTEFIIKLPMKTY